MFHMRHIDSLVYIDFGDMTDDRTNTNEERFA